MEITDKSMFEQYKLLLNYVDVQLWTLTNIETYGFVNKAHADFVGKLVEELENKKLNEIFTIEEADICKESNMRVWEEKQQIITKEWITNNKGQARLLHITKTPILDEEDNIKYIICKAYDITEEEETRKKIRINEQQYFAIVENEKNLICKFKPDTELIYANQAYCNFFGKKYEELIGTKFLTLVPEEFHDCIEELLTSFTMDDPIKTYEHSVINSHGGLSWQRWTDQAFFDENGEIIEFQSVGVDITEMKEKEEALKKKVEENRKKIDEMLEYDKLKTEFLANISHELRTPLNLILGALQLLDLEINSGISLQLSRIKKNNDIIKQNCYRLLRIINNLIDITKIDAGYFRIKLKNCNIVSIIEDVTMSVAEYIKNNNIQLLFDTEIEEKVMACDPDQIERIILNLLSNSVKFTKPGGKIFVNIYDKGKSISISVKDTGIGIPKDKMGVIFRRFIQLDKSFTRNHEGSGIGLSLTKSLVKMHEGEIEVKSQSGKGTEFIITLPVKIMENERPEINNIDTKNKYVERINVEFSDIYMIR